MRRFLGEAEITTGIWLGGSTTPNKRADALAVLRSLNKGDGLKENQFVLDRCPWCGATDGTGRSPGRGRGRRGIPRVIGYEKRDNTVIYKCPDRRCDFRESLPLYVIDEDIYEVPPGTGDRNGGQVRDACLEAPGPRSIRHRRRRVKRSFAAWTHNPGRTPSDLRPPRLNGWPL